MPHPKGRVQVLGTFYMRAQRHSRRKITKFCVVIKPDVRKIYTG